MAKKRKPYNASTGRKYTGNSYDALYGKRTSKQRSQRNKARRKMAKKIGKKAIKGKDVAHRRSISKGGGNGFKNLTLSSPSKNRGRKGEGGRKKGKKK